MEDGEQKRLEDYIESLLPEERETFQDLIQECLERSHRIKEYSEKAFRSLEQLSDMVRKLKREIARLEAGQRLQSTLADDLNLKAMREINAVRDYPWSFN